MRDDPSQDYVVTPRHVRFHLTLMYALSYSEKAYRLSCCEPDGLQLDRPEYFCQVQYTHVTGSIASLSGKFIKQICLRHILLIASSEHMSIKKIKDNNINSIHQCQYAKCISLDEIIIFEDIRLTNFINNIN